MGRVKGAVATCIVLAGVVWAPAGAYGNGKGFPMVAYPETPEIPTQRAMIVWRDGVETLTVESAVRTPSPEVGWVLPLPAEPHRLTVADPGLLKSMSFCQRPRITASLGDSSLQMYCVVAVLPVVLLIVFRRPPIRRAHALLALLLSLLIASFLVPSLAGIWATAGASSGRPTTGVIVASTHRVGNYDATVLRADNRGALDKWLTASGLVGLDAADRRVVDEYIARKWCFVVARLRKNSEIATPHPISAAFRTETPVYPMTLTGLTPGETRVELYVIADRQASTEDIPATMADTYTRGNGDARDRTPEQTHPYRAMQCFRAETTGLVIGHPDAVDLMWDGCVVTTLVATLGPEDMTKDVELSFTNVRPHRPHVYTQAARNDVFEIVLTSGTLLVLLVAALVYRGRPKRRWAVHAAVLSLVVGVPAAAWISSSSLPVIPAYVSTRSGRPKLRLSLLRKCFMWGEMVLTEQGTLPEVAEGQASPPRTRAEAREIMSAGLKDFGAGLAENPFTGEPIRAERSPGNYWFMHVQGKLTLCYYDANAVEWRYTFPPYEPPSDVGSPRSGVNAE